VASLIGKNLIRQQLRPDGTSHYVMVETIREYGLRELEAHGEADSVWKLHATACLALATEGESHLVHSVEPAWLDRLEINHENFRRTLAWTFRPGQSASATSCGVQLAGALWLFWYYHGHLTEGRHWLELALGTSDEVPDSARAKVLLGLGTLLHYQGEKSRARMRLSEGLAVSQRLDDPWATAYLMTACGNLAEDEGKYDEASVHFSEANVLFSDVGDHVNVAVTLYHLGVVAFGQGHLELALTQCQKALELSRSSNDPWTTAASLAYLGLIWTALGKLERSASALGEALKIYRRIQTPERIAEVLSRTAVVAQMRGRSAVAIRLFAAAESIGERIGVHHELPEATHYDQSIAAIRQTLSPEDFTAAWTDGRVLSMTEAIADAETELHSGASGAPVVAGAHASTLESTALIEDLSPREIEVLRLLVNGKTDQQIAEMLFISRRTVATHLNHIYGKLGISSRTAAAAFAVRHGLA
ncbi:MAG: LuxR C-terminal-related transcriptional regulator, partial [Chloroflexota bacterium]|nr:LuxR C-terminal-related transcriptional regulator [Chloroflexota bacterium]